MKEYILTEDKIEELRELLNDDSHSKHYVRTEIMKNLLPELFEEGFEVGKYYEFVYKECHFVFKVTEIRDNGLIEGYGLDLDPFDEEGVLFEHTRWTEQEDFEYAKEITREEFMSYIKTYAIEELGFKEGVKYKSHDGGTEIALHDPEQMGSYETLHCGKDQGIIYEDGKFLGEVIEKPKKKYDKVIVNFENEIFETLIEVFKTTEEGKNIDFSDTTTVEINKV